MKRVINRKATCKELKKRAEENGFTARDIAMAIGASDRAVYKWLKGASFPSTNHLYSLCRVLKVKMEDVIVRI